MLKEIKINTITLTVLLVLIIAIFLLAENKASSSFSIIASLTAIKFMAVSFQFMETKKTNIFWKILICLFVIAFLIGVSVLS
ncbi:MAG: hypothetical protein P1U44_01375 [Vicingaceae bacterium]|jgi:hypothetical protein|nr:hypothetical protein [Flavobacteriales bacterium]MBL1233869.1 hypothetical protein [Flavobacteriales bacterium]MBQ21414.1 hypothetical protein [Flavobacteriales bacterium]MDF1674336.1 hypothetical protein [Vicingaceae bacterium]|tara:strand:+ start:144509 stop:144754 length:246 start_codon:yes stop_codon:yes gene_type:complete